MSVVGAEAPLQPVLDQLLAHAQATCEEAAEAPPGAAGVRHLQRLMDSGAHFVACAALAVRLEPGLVDGALFAEAACGVVKDLVVAARPIVCGPVQVDTDGEDGDGDDDDVADLALMTRKLLADYPLANLDPLCIDVAAELERVWDCEGEGGARRRPPPATQLAAGAPGFLAALEESLVEMAQNAVGRCVDECVSWVSGVCDVAFSFVALGSNDG